MACVGYLEQSEVHTPTCRWILHRRRELRPRYLGFGGQPDSESAIPPPRRPLNSRHKSTIRHADIVQEPKRVEEVRLACSVGADEEDSRLQFNLDPKEIPPVLQVNPLESKRLASSTTHTHPPKDTAQSRGECQLRATSYQVQRSRPTSASVLIPQEGEVSRRDYAFSTLR